MSLIHETTFPARGPLPRIGSGSETINDDEVANASRRAAAAEKGDDDPERTFREATALMTESPRASTVDVHAHIDAPAVYGLVQDEPGLAAEQAAHSRPSARNRSSATPG